MAISTCFSRQHICVTPIGHLFSLSRSTASLAGLGGRGGRAGGRSYVELGIASGTLLERALAFGSGLHGVGDAAGDWGGHFSEVEEGVCAGWKFWSGAVEAGGMM